MTLLAPLALWGLLALAVPLLLHLRRRRVGRTIQVGSLRHLETLPTAERRGPRVRDPLRLLLRLSILALLVLVLAGPALDRVHEDQRPLVLVDSSSAPWDLVAQVDDSLAPGIPLTVVATRSSDRYSGPRPLVRRKVTWIDADTVKRASATPTAVHPHSPAERRALDAAVAAAVDLLGAPRDTAGWEGSLPEWWRDSLLTPAFPVAVARALFPTRGVPLPSTLGIEQVTPAALGGREGGSKLSDLHWWVWGLAALLFLVERLWARRLEGGA